VLLCLSIVFQTRFRWVIIEIPDWRVLDTARSNHTFFSGRAALRVAFVATIELRGASGRSAKRSLQRTIDSCVGPGALRYSRDSEFGSKSPIAGLPLPYLFQHPDRQTANNESALHPSRRGSNFAKTAFLLTIIAISVIIIKSRSLLDLTTMNRPLARLFRRLPAALVVATLFGGIPANSHHRDKGPHKETAANVPAPEPDASLMAEASVAPAAPVPAALAQTIASDSGGHPDQYAYYAESLSKTLNNLTAAQRARIFSGN
jgi:hypothetical protein